MDFASSIVSERDSRGRGATAFAIKWIEFRTAPLKTPPAPEASVAGSWFWKNTVNLGLTSNL